MKVAYCTSSHEGVASFRYRVQCPSSRLLVSGIKTEIGTKVPEDAAVVVFSKHWTMNDWSYAKFCSLRGQKVVFDICDDHFEHPKHKDHYMRMSLVADQLVVNSNVMREHVKKYTGRDSIVIHDPVLSERRAPSVGEPHLVWYGQLQNIKGLYEAYPEGTNIPLEVIVPAPLDPPEHFKLPHVSWTQWHPNVLEGASERNTIALLPYRQNRPAKSANRVLEAIWSGLYVMTDRLPAVEELGEDGIWYLEKGFHKGIEKYNEGVADEIERQQMVIYNQYSPAVITEKWANLFKELGGKV